MKGEVMRKHGPQTLLTQVNITCQLQQDISYFGQQVALVIDQHGTCWVSIPSACKALGLNTRGQQQRIERTQELAQASCQITVSTRGGAQRVNCLRVELLAIWLEGVKNLEKEMATRFREILSEAALALKKQHAQQLVNHNPSVVYQLPLPLDETTAEIDRREDPIVTTALPGLGQVLVVTNYPEDRAIREATFAQSSGWREEPIRRRPYYMASNAVRVSLGDPAHPLLIEDAQAALRQLKESTVLTARYILGRWHIAREQDRLAKEGSVFIQAEELLEWRGIQPHSRLVYPGTEVRQIDGYERKYLDQVHQDIKLLELFHLQGQHRLLVGGQIHVLSIDGPYLRATHVQKSDQSAYFIAPGGWINVWIAAMETHGGGLWIAELDRRIFKMHPHNDQLALRLALFLVEHWQMHLAAGLAMVPLRMEDLLTSSMIPIDRANLTLRFAPRIEAAIQKLVVQGIIGQARPQQPLLKQGRWGKAWLAMIWEITPPAELVKRYEVTKPRQSFPVLLPPPTAQSTGDNAEHRRQQQKRVKSIQRNRAT